MELTEGQAFAVYAVSQGLKELERQTAAAAAESIKRGRNAAEGNELCGLIMDAIEELYRRNH